MPRSEHVAVIPGVGEVDNASGFIDIRYLGNRASLARAIEIAMMSSPPLAIVLTDEQRAAHSHLDVTAAGHREIGVDSEGNSIRQPLVANVRKKVDGVGREYIEVGGAVDSRITLVQVAKGSSREVKASDSRGR